MARRVDNVPGSSAAWPSIRLSLAATLRRAGHRVVAKLKPRKEQRWRSKPSPARLGAVPALGAMQKSGMLPGQPAWRQLTLGSSANSGGTDRFPIGDEAVTCRVPTSGLVSMSRLVRPTSPRPRPLAEIQLTPDRGSCALPAQREGSGRRCPGYPWQSQSRSRRRPTALPVHAYRGHAGMLAPSLKRGHAVGADPVAAFRVQQRPRGSVRRGRRSGEPVVWQRRLRRLFLGGTGSLPAALAPAKPSGFT